MNTQDVDNRFDEKFTVPVLHTGDVYIDKDDTIVAKGEGIYFYASDIKAHIHSELELQAKEIFTDVEALMAKEKFKVSLSVSYEQLRQKYLSEIN